MTAVSTVANSGMFIGCPLVSGSSRSPDVAPTHGRLGQGRAAGAHRASAMGVQREAEDRPLAAAVPGRGKALCLEATL